nr:glycosyltransferase family 4 protein [uncultured Desulfobacter sp.]
MRSIRVANIIEEGKIGGPQITIMMVAAALNKSFETTVIMPKQNSEQFQSQCKALGIQYHAMFLTRITKEWKVALGYILFSPFEVLRLAMFFRKKKFDLVHVSGGSWQYKGIIAGRLAGCRVIWGLNDTSMPSLVRTLFSFFSRYCDGYIHTCKRTRAYYAPYHKPGKPEFIILPPVDTEHFHPGRRGSGDETLIDQWHGKKVIGTVANINPVKGLETFIRAAAILNKKKKESLLFVIIGPVFHRQKKYFSSLTSLAAELGVDNLVFAGARKDIRPLLSSFDIFCCTSLFESGPMTLWEAMSMEKPVVSTDVGDVSTYVKDDENGYIVNVGDAKTISDRLTSLIDNDELRAEFGRKSRKTVKHYLDISISAKQHKKAYTFFANL